MRHSLGGNTEITVKRLYVGLGCIAVLLAVLLAVGPFEEWRLLRRFERRDAVEDARKALAMGDHRLLAGDYGWGLRTPGLESRDSGYQAILAAHGTRRVIKMSDAIYSDLQQRLWESSQSYLTRYNAVVLEAGR